jgi:broad specificity phosphatase PhoE
MKIVIMRHGQPTTDLNALKRKRLSPHDISKIVNAYELVGLSTENSPNRETKHIANQCKIALSSDLPRAVESLEILAPTAYTSDKIFRESTLPHFSWHYPKLSFFTWAIIFRVFWLFGFSKNGESIKVAKQRAKIGANQLHELAFKHDSVLLLGHGIINRLLIKELTNRGWRKTRCTGENYWSYKEFEFSD